MVYTPMSREILRSATFQKGLDGQRETGNRGRGLTRTSVHRAKAITATQRAGRSEQWQPDAEEKRPIPAGIQRTI